jgi:hypothetical protein
MRLMALIAAIGLVPLAVGMVVVRRSSAGHARVALDQALTSDSRDHAAALDSYFERARSVILITAQNPALRSSTPFRVTIPTHVNQLEQAA